MRGIGRYWGYLLFLVLMTAWWNQTVGPIVLGAMSLLVTAFFLFQAPVWCCAVNRDGTLCRNNSRGLLRGCSNRQHKWQKLKMAIIPKAWRQMNRAFWARPQEAMSTIGAAVGLISTLVAAGMAVAERT